MDWTVTVLDVYPGLGSLDLTGISGGFPLHTHLSTVIYYRIISFYRLFYHYIFVINRTERENLSITRFKLHNLD